MGDVQSQAHVFWNPGTRLFEVVVLRRSGPDLLIKHLSLHTAERLSEAIIDVLRERCRYLLLPACIYNLQTDRRDSSGWATQFPGMDLLKLSEKF